MKLINFILFFLLAGNSFCQSFDTCRYIIHVESIKELNKFFTNDPLWQGADGASSVDMGNGRVPWLFSDSFIAVDSPYSRRGSKIVRNSIALQYGHDLKTVSLKYYWKKSRKKPVPFFELSGKEWYWSGHGIMVNNKLLIFLMKEKHTKKGLGFEATGWAAVLIFNPAEDPSQWKMKYIEGPETYGQIAGSAAVLKDELYIYICLWRC